MQTLSALQSLRAGIHRPPKDAPHKGHVDGLMQERSDFIANAQELRLSCTKPSMVCGDLTFYLMLALYK